MSIPPMTTKTSKTPTTTTIRLRSMLNSSLTLCARACARSVEADTQGGRRSALGERSARHGPENQLLARMTPDGRCSGSPEDLPRRSRQHDTYLGDRGIEADEKPAQSRGGDDSHRKLTERAPQE